MDFFFTSLSLFLPLALLFGLEVQPSPLLKPRLTHLLTVLVSKRKEEKTRRGENRPGCRGPSLFLDTLSRLSVFLCCEVCVVLKGAPKTLFPLKNSNIGFSLSLYEFLRFSFISRMLVRFFFSVIIGFWVHKRLKSFCNATGRLGDCREGNVKKMKE